MTNKLVITKEQADALDKFLEVRKEFPVSSFSIGRPFSGTFLSLNTLTLDEFSRAVYSGYEVEYNAEQEYWDALGRNVAEFHEGDVMLDKNGGYIHGSRYYAAQQYYEGNFSGLYPAESFRPYGKDVR